MTVSRSTDLARRATRGDRAALEVLWQEHRRWVAAILLARGPGGAAVEDLLQEVAVSVCQNIHRLREPEQFLPWLRSIALNRARDARRRATTRGRIERPLEADHHPVEEAGVAAGGDEDHVLGLLGRLREEYREPLFLKAVRGLSQKQIAAILGLPETTVESRLVRARRTLRQELERVRGRVEETEAERWRASP